jgi:S1-C subfamily serine protease
VVRVALTCRGWRVLVFVWAWITWGAAARCGEPARGPDVVRPTVQLRNGDKRGSGTVIVSIPDQTWILTAAHVVANATELKVELHHFNFGSRVTGLTEGNGWPRLVPATVGSIDLDRDVALVRIKGMKALPFVARLDPVAGEPGRGEVFTSVGIDRGLHLTSWRTTIEGIALIDMGKGGGKRPFTVTSHPPDHGRSGGGLFRADGAVLGVCTGHFDNKPGQTLGVFAAMESVRQMVYSQSLEAMVRRPDAQP